MTALFTLVALLSAGNIGAEQLLPAPQIEHAVRREVTARLRAMGCPATVNIAGRIADQKVPAGTARIEVRETGGPWPRARAGIPVRLVVNERAAKSITVWVELKDERTLMIYAANYPARTAGDRIEMAPARLNAACSSDEQNFQAAEIAPLRTRRSVRAGAPVRRADFEQVPDVVVRQHVDIELRRGAVRLATVGTAVTDGRIGEEIMVRVEPAHVLVQGRVVANQRVSLDE